MRLRAYSTPENVRRQLWLLETKLLFEEIFSVLLIALHADELPRVRIIRFVYNQVQADEILTVIVCPLQILSSKLLSFVMHISHIFYLAILVINVRLRFTKNQLVAVKGLYYDSIILLFRCFFKLFFCFLLHSQVAETR